MLISENDLRRIIRRKIISEGPVTTAVGTAMIGAAPTVARWLVDYGKEIYRDGKKLAIMTVQGDVVPPKGLLNSAEKDVNSILIDLGNNKAPHAYNVLGKGKVKGIESIVFSIPKKFHKNNKETLKGLKINPLPFEDIKVTHFGAKTTLSGDATKKRTEGSAKYLRVYIPATFAKTSEQISFTKEELKTGAASIADLAIEVGGILGGIPAIGNVADVGTAMLAIVKKPPDYLLAALSILCALPAIGIGVAAVAKPIAKKFSGKAAKEAGEAIGKELKTVLKKEGIEVSEELIEKMESQVGEAIEGLRSSEVLEKLAETLNKDADEITEGLDEVQDVLDTLINSLKDEADSAIRSGKDASKIVKMTDAEVKVAKAQTRKAAGSVLKSLQSGRLKRKAIEFAKEIQELKKVEFKKALDSTIQNNPRGLIGAHNDFLEAYGENLKGMVFPIGPPVNRDITFEGGSEFFTTVMEFAGAAGVSNPPAFFKDAVETMFEKGYKPVTEENINGLVSAVFSQMKNIKFTATSDVGLARDLRMKTAGKSKSAGVTDRSTVYGQMYPAQRGNPPKLQMNYAAFKENAPIEEAVQTLEHEILHHVDNMLCTAMSLGDDFAAKIMREKNLSFMSELKANKVLNPDGVSGKMFKDKSLKAAIDAKDVSGNTIKNYLDNNADKSHEWFITGFKNTFEVPRLHASAMYWWSKFNKAKFDGANPEKVKNLFSWVHYSGDPAEMFVRVQRMANFMEDAGVDLASDSSIIDFFRNDSAVTKLRNGVKDVKNDLMFLNMIGILNWPGAPQQEITRQLTAFRTFL